MSSPVISVEHLYKQYRLGTINHGMLVKDLQSWWARARGKEDPNARLVVLDPHNPNRSGAFDDRFWALDDVSFEVQQGEVLGIIGRNGAGKSTLLKILSKVTTPTRGEVRLKGRVASLLEVGTGFHAELTGRENVFLNGAILGMTKDEIKRRFEEIVAFAELERFIDTPVKRYSSGMYVRLAFAVAAHLEPEILIVDEVLAVGDVGFQKKCLGKMGDVSRAGRTILFVSHQMGPVGELCSRALLLSQGKIVEWGNTLEVIGVYITSKNSKITSFYQRKDDCEKEMYFVNVSVENEISGNADLFTLSETVKISMTCAIRQFVPNTTMGFYVKDERGRMVFTSNYAKWSERASQQRTVEASVMIPPQFLVPGHYYLSCAIVINNGKLFDFLEDQVKFTILDSGSEFSMFEGYDHGCIFSPCKWVDKG
jgi:lipopolysaccharide transport system ATP-binding protein